MRMLIVEDNADMRRLIRLIVADLTDEIVECDDGSEVLGTYRKVHPDWVLMDFEMKQMDGITATRNLTAAHPEAKVVMVTNYDGTVLREAASAAGARGYVLKENLMELRTILHEAPLF